MLATSHMANSSTPVIGKERIEILDIVRGFALLGVMMDNLFGFSGWGFLTDAGRQSLPTWPADAIIGLLEQVFINGKFYSLFSMLFGVGFAIILTRHQQKGTRAIPVFYRRLFILALIGALHLRFMWEGDILLLYAMVGMLLPLFRSTSNRTLLIVSAALVLSPILFDLCYVILQWKPGAGLFSIAQQIDQQNGIPLDQQGYADYLYKDGSGWREWQNWLGSGWAYRYSYLLETNRIPKVLAMFLLGFYIGRNAVHERLGDHVGLMRKIRFWGLLIGIPAGIGSFYMEFFQPHIPKPIGLVHTFLYAISVVPLSLAYASMICLRWVRKQGNSRLRWLAPLGRMALTNYIMQTLIGIFLYYGVGLGIGGHIGPAVFIPIGLVVYLFQVAFSTWWLKHFQFGPLEWIWRQLTYGKRLPLRVGRKDASV